MSEKLSKRMKKSFRFRKDDGDVTLLGWLFICIFGMMWTFLPFIALIFDFMFFSYYIPTGIFTLFGLMIWIIDIAMFIDSGYEKGLF